MGYYSTFKLTVQEEDGSPLQEPDFSQIVEHFDILGVINYALTETLDTYENVKWYNSDEHIGFVSKLFPKYIFVLTRDGEEPGDHSKTFYKEGKMQRTQARMVYDEFDPNKLKDCDLFSTEKEFQQLKKEYDLENFEEIRRQELLSKMSEKDKAILGL